MSRRAFTLIEVLFIMATVMILAAIAVPNFLEAQTRSKYSRMRSDMAQISAALRAYESDWGNFPPNSPERRRFLAACAQTEVASIEAVPTPDDATHAWTGGGGFVLQGVAPTSTRRSAASTAPLARDLLGPPTGSMERIAFEMLGDLRIEGQDQQATTTPTTTITPTSDPTMDPFGDNLGLFAPAAPATTNPPLPHTLDMYWSYRYGNRDPFGARNRGQSYYTLHSHSGQDLSRLSTPVAYFANRVPLDVFARSGGYWREEELPEHLMYVNYHDLRRLAPSPVLPFPSDRFLLMSVGPSNGQPPEFLNPVLGPFDQYDPTNGTISRGDIVDFGR